MNVLEYLSGLQSLFQLFYSKALWLSKDLPFFCLSLFIYLFIHLETERVSREGAEREGERESPASSALSAWRLDAGLELTNRETTTWAETKSQRFNWMSHPGAPKALPLPI